MSKIGIAEKKADKKKRIIEAAKQLFAARGYQNTTIEDIAAMANIAKGTVYLYFKDKLQLFRYIVKELSDQQEKNQIGIHEYKEWKERLYHYILLQLRFFQDNAYLAHITVKEINGVDKEVAEILFKSLERHIHLLTSIIRGGVKNGDFAVADERKAAVAFMGMVNYYIVYEFLEGKEKNLQETAEFLLNLFLKGIET